MHYICNKKQFYFISNNNILSYIHLLAVYLQCKVSSFKYRKTFLIIETHENALVNY